MHSMADVKPKRRHHRDRRAGWEHHTNNTLTSHVGGPYTYGIDLDEMTSLHELVDWIDHMSTKTWVTPDVLSGLVHALLANVSWRDL
jgi:hypothetical protein